MLDPDLKSLSIVVPVYNNVAHLALLHARVVDAMTGIDLQWELILVDDGSEDGSWDSIRLLGRQDHRVLGLRLSRNFGQHAAISAGFELASGDACILMDADLQDRPEMIPLLIDTLKAGDYDIVYTIKQNETEGLSRRLTSRAFHSVIGFSTGMPQQRSIGTYRIFHRKVLDALLQYTERAIVYGPLMHTMGFNCGFLEIPRDERQGSGSSYSFRRRLALAYQSVMSYSTLPQKAMLWLGSTVCAASILYLVVIIAQYFLVGRDLPPGLTMLTVLLLFSTGSLMLGMGVLASYLFLIFRETLARPRYHLRSVINERSNRNAS